jgi:hypothetical protein
MPVRIGGSGQTLRVTICAMAKRRITFGQWLRLVAKHSLPGDPEFGNVAGLPRPDVAERLGVHRSRVHQLIESGVLDVVEVINAAGAVTMTLVTESSLERYLAERVPDRNRQGYFAFPAA